MSRIFERNGTLKIISVVIAIILWMYAVSELNPETTLNITDVPIAIINEDILKDKKLTIAYDPGNKTNIRIRGLVNDIRKINTANIKAVLDLGTIDWTGTKQVALNVEGLLPREVRLDKTPEVSVTVNNIETKIIPIKIQVTGKEAEGFYRHPEVIEPQSITIYGAESLVQSVVQGIIQVNLKNDESTIEQSLPIRLIDADERIVDSEYVKLRQENAMVTIPIYPTKALAIKPNILGKPAEGFIVENVEVEPKNLNVNGYASIVNKLEEMVTEVVDIQGTKKDVNVTVNLQQIEGLFISPSQSQQVNVIVRVSETIIDKSFVLNDIIFKNPPDGNTVKVVNEPITIRVKGPYTIVNPMTVSVFEPTVDLAGLEPGEYQLPLTVLIPEGTEKIDMTSEVVTVNISPIEVP